MRIKQIKINNFRQYHDVNLVFEKTHGNDLNYILAENGIGKTTLLNAITWCLYNKELHITEELKDKTLPLLSLCTLREMAEGEEKDTVVSIVIEDSDSEVQFERRETFRKTENNEAYSKLASQKVIISPNDGSTDILTTEEEYKIEVNKRLPFRIQQFFFFDGEQLDTYLAKAAGANVENTVLQISQIDLLVTMQKNLENIASELRREVSRSNSKSEELNQQYETKLSYVNEFRDALAEQKQQLEAAKSELVSIREELGDEPDIAELESKRDGLDKQLFTIKEEQKQNTLKIKSFLKQYMKLLYALPKMKSMYDLILEKEENNQLPPKYDKAELEKMLTSHHCEVCDRDLDSDATVHLVELIKRYELGQETGIILSRMHGCLQRLISDANKYESIRDDLYSQKQKLEQDYNSISDQLKEIDSIIDKYTNKERIKTLYSKRSELENLVEDETKKVIKKEVDLENEEKLLEALHQELEKSLSKDEKTKQLRAEKELTEKASQKVLEIISEIKGSIRKQISDEMASKFMELMWKKKFSKVELTSNYSASVINNDGFECLGSCSAAERELLVLAFTLALHKESGFDGPLVIDTPISRISGQLRVAFAKVLKTVSESKQIILFVTKDEYSDNVKDVFESCANKKYEFELIDEDYVKVGEI